MTEAAAFWITAAGRGEVRAESVATPARGEVTVRARYSGVSRGTESLVFQGLVPPSEYERMRCPFQNGDFPWPVKYGYASVGEIAADGSDIPESRLTERVFCLHPHQSSYTVPAKNVVPIPDDVPDRRAVLAANMETAVNALWDAAPAVGDRVAVIGAGTVGCLVASLASQIPCATVELIDVEPSRAQVAAALGVGFSQPAGARGDADVVFHASGAESGLTSALDLAGFEAAIWEMSWYGTARPALALGESFHAKRLTIAASQVGHVAPRRRARRTRRERLALALRLLKESKYDCLLSGECALADLPAVMPRLASPKSGALCHVVRYE